MIVGNDQDGDDVIITAHVCAHFPAIFIFLLYSMASSSYHKKFGLLLRCVIVKPLGPEYQMLEFDLQKNNKF